MFSSPSGGMEGLKPASQLKSGSVMDILGKGGLKSSTESITKPAAQLKSGTEPTRNINISDTGALVISVKVDIVNIFS